MFSFSTILKCQQTQTTHPNRNDVGHFAAAFLSFITTSIIILILWMSFFFVLSRQNDANGLDVYVLLTIFWFYFLLLPFSLFFVFGLIQLGHEKYNWYSTRQFIFIGFTFQCKYNNNFRRCAHWEWVDNWIAKYRFYHFFNTFLSLTSMHDEAHLDMMEHFFNKTEAFFGKYDFH